MPEYLQNLIYVFKWYYTSFSPINENQPAEVRHLAEKVLGFFDLEYDVYDETITWRNEQPIPLKDFNGPVQYLITPKDLSWQDLQDLQSLLSKNKDLAYTVRPLFEALGWTVQTDEDSVTLHYFGKPTETKWAEIWDLDQMEEEHWKDLENAPDPWNREKIEKNHDWLKS